MAKFELITKTFKDKISGESISYERLQCTATVNGKPRVLELKLDNSDVIAVESLLNSSDSNLEVHLKKPSSEDIDKFLSKNNADPDVFNLEE